MTTLQTVEEVARTLGHKIIKAIKEWQESKPRQETFWLDDVILSDLTQDRQHILEVLKEGVNNLDFYGWDKNNQRMIKDKFEALLQETLGEGKEINSIFKE